LRLLSCLEKEVKACIDEFTAEIHRSKLAMQSHITESITLVFENELSLLDRTFVDFRKVTHIDQNNIPKIEAKLQALEMEVSAI